MAMVDEGRWRQPAAEFFEVSPVVFAPALLGCVVEHAGVLIRITETEAYWGAQDPGSHAFRRRTERNDALFGPPGTVYAYVNYGIHRALNIVCGRTDEAAGALIRAGEVISGHDVARNRRSAPSGMVPSDRQLTRGPGNLAKALAVEVDLCGTPVTGPDAVVRLFVPSSEVSAGPIRSGPRVGVSGPGGDAGDFPWRFWLDGDPTVSSYRAAKKPRTHKTT